MTALKVAAAMWRHGRMPVWHLNLPAAMRPLTAAVLNVIPTDDDVGVLCVGHTFFTWQPALSCSPLRALYFMCRHMLAHGITMNRPAISRRGDFLTRTALKVFGSYQDNLT